MQMNRLMTIAAATLSLLALVTLGVAVAVQISNAKAQPPEVLTVSKASKAKYPPKKCIDCGVVVAVKAADESRYVIRILMSDGSLKIVTSHTQPIWKEGDPVRVLNGRVVG